MNKLSTLILGSALSVSALTAFADTASQTPANQQTGVYAGVNLGLTQSFGHTDSFAYDYLDSSWGGYSPFVGYQFNPYLALETGYIHYGDFQNELTNVTLVNTNQALYLAAKGILPLGDNWQLYGKLGGAEVYTTLKANTVDTSDTIFKSNVFAPYGGLGVSYFLTQHMSVSLESACVAPKFDEAPYRVALCNHSLGLSYLF